MCIVQLTFMVRYVKVNNSEIEIKESLLKIKYLFLSRENPQKSLNLFSMSFKKTVLRS